VKTPAATDATHPRREDIGDLIVLHLHGSYREMGRQQIELLGTLARDIYDLHRADWSALLATLGPLAAVDWFLPRFWMTAGPRYEKSGLYQEIKGFGDGLGVSGPAAWRGVVGALGGGTTTFAATRTATADGTAILAKNTDWPDRYGQRPPMVTHYRPTNSDMAHVVAGWPLTPLPAAGMNEAGLAYGLNFFNADQVLALGLPHWPYRRVLQKASTVSEAIRIITASPNRGISGFISLADAAGDIAMVECTPGDSAIFRPEGDWFALSNHACTEKMVKHDRGRGPNSFARRLAMEAAVERNLGSITPETSPLILRDRSNSTYVNESTVANLAAFHSVVMHPASRTLWHSTMRQPLAPFGELAAFAPGSAGSPQEALPADPRLGTPEMDRETTIVRELREAMRLFDDGSVREAGAIWDRYGAKREPAVQPHRLDWARARARWTLGQLDEAVAILAELDVEDVPFDVRANALTATALVLDRQGQRPEAVAACRRAMAYLDENPQYNDGLIAPLRKRAADVLKAPQTAKPMPAFPALQGIPN
jgi:hypothetical protein